MAWPKPAAGCHWGGLALAPNATAALAKACLWPTSIGPRTARNDVNRELAQLPATMGEMRPVGDVAEARRVHPVPHPAAVAMLGRSSPPLLLQGARLSCDGRAGSV